MDEYLNLVYSKTADLPIGLYIGYYKSQREGDTMHSPLNCLPGAGWAPESQSYLTIPVSTSPGAAPQPITVNRYLIRKGADRQLVLYWYQSHGRVVASEYSSKIFMVLDAIRTNRTDGALVRVITPVLDEDAGAVTGREARRRIHSGNGACASRVPPVMINKHEQRKDPFAMAFGCRRFSSRTWGC